MNCRGQSSCGDGVCLWVCARIEICFVARWNANEIWSTHWIDIGAHDNTDRHVAKFTGETTYSKSYFHAIAILTLTSTPGHDIMIHVKFAKCVFSISVFSPCQFSYGGWLANSMADIVECVLVIMTKEFPAIRVDRFEDICMATVEIWLNRIRWFNRNWKSVDVTISVFNGKPVELD